MTTTNWAGNYTFRAPGRHTPTSVQAVQELVASAPRIHVVGCGHSFTGIADAEQMLSLALLPPEIRVDRERRTVSCSPGLTYGALAEALHEHGLALHNMASLPQITLAGAIVTATHGSGDGNANLATAVAGLELVTSSGEIVRAQRGDADFAGLVVSLGVAGVLTRLTLDVEPTYAVAQRVYDNLTWTALRDHFDAVMSSAYSVSLFTTWGDDGINQVWVKARAGQPSPISGDDLFGAHAAPTERHPVAGMDPVACTRQLGQPGAWFERLPHFRMGFVPSAGQELQSEYHLPRRDALSAIDALRGVAQHFRRLLQCAEIRTVAADDLWLSPQYERDSVAFHFTWVPDQPAVERALVELETALAPFDPRPHWGKLFLTRADQLASTYRRLPDFLRLVDRLDPRGAFRNDWFEGVIGVREKLPGSDRSG